MQARVNGGTGTLTYEWRDNTELIIITTSNSIRHYPSTAVSHTYSVKVTDSASPSRSAGPFNCTPQLKVETNISQCGGGGGPGNPNCPAGQICNALGTTDIMVFLKKALLALVNLLIPIIVLFYIIVGLMFITARGAPEKLKVAKTAFLYVTIGSAVVLGAWALAEMIQTTIQTVQS